MQAFSRSSSSHEEEDVDINNKYEAPKWTELQRLPTFNRLKKGFLVTCSSGEAREVDVRNLAFLERKELVDRLVGEDEDDHSEFLFKLKNRFDRYAKKIK